MVTHNCLTAVCPGLPGWWARTTRNIHPRRKKRLAQTTRSIVWELIPFTGLSVSALLDQIKPAYNQSAGWPARPDNTSATFNKVAQKTGHSPCTYNKTRPDLSDTDKHYT